MSLKEIGLSEDFDFLRTRFSAWTRRLRVY